MSSDVSFLGMPDFWKGIAFFLSVCVVLLPVWHIGRKMIKDQIQKTTQHMNEAFSLFSDAQHNLQSAKRRMKGLAADKRQLLLQTEQSVSTLQSESDAALEEAKLSKQKENEERVCLIYENGLKSLHEQVLDIAVDATKSVLREKPVRQACTDVFMQESLSELQQVLLDKENVSMLKNVIMEEG